MTQDIDENDVSERLRTGDLPVPENWLPGTGEMAARMRSFDWRGSALGPVTPSLRAALVGMLEAQSAAAVAWGPEFRMFYNDRYRPLLGSKKHPRALGRPARDVFPEAWDRLEPHFERARQGEAFAVEDWNLTLERNDHVEDCWFTLSYVPIREEMGSVGGILTLVTETTSRVEDERRFRTLRDLARHALGARSPEQVCRAAARAFECNRLDTPFAVLYLLSEDGTFARRVAYVGLPPGHPANLPRLSLGNGDPGASSPIAEVVRSGKPLVLTDLPNRFGWISGGPCPEPTHTALVLPIGRAGRRHPRAVLIAGVSPRRALDRSYRTFYELVAHQIARGLECAASIQAERRRAAHLLELDRKRTKFLSDLSHEFRTPLALLLGPIEDVLVGARGALNDEQRRELELARRNGLVLHKIVESLLDLGRLEAGRAEPSFEPVELGQFTLELANQFRSTIERAGLEFSIDCPSLDEPFYVDRGMWQKVVFNLLSNAFKFTLQGSIAVSLHPVDGGVELVVKDTGSGIPAHELPRVFERFHRVPGARSRTREGAGIGLSLSQELVRLHGGEISVESEPGVGSTFRVRLRAGSAHLPRECVCEEPPLRSRAQSENPFTAEASRWLPDSTTSEGETRDRARILVVDDNADMRQYLRRLLEERWAVEMACDGAEALELIRRTSPDLVLADVSMPGLDGFGLLRLMRADPKTRSTPVILLTAHASDPGRAEGLDAGAIDYLVKPFSARELVASVAAALNAAQARREAEVANRSKDEFLALLGHELRNPLAPILTALELMKLKDAKLLQRERNVIERQVRHMVQLVDDLLDVSRVTRGKVQLRLEPVEIATVIAQAVETVGPLLEQRQHRLSVAVPRAGLCVRGDPFRLAQVFANLLTNAAKYTPPGGQIVVHATSRDGRVEVVVSDNGSGIEPSMLERIFEPFVQGERRTEGSSGGLGLGLSLVRSLVALHEGRVYAKSAGLGTGSEFVVELPLLPDEAPSPSVGMEEVGVATDGGRRRALVVDDNADAAEMIAEGLRVLGYDVRVAYDAQTALTMASEFRPEYAILDIGLPVVDGYELGRQLRQLFGDDLALIAVTGYGQDGDRERSRKACFTDHLVKPIDLGVLARTLEQARARAARAEP